MKNGIIVAAIAVVVLVVVGFALMNKSSANKASSTYVSYTSTIATGYQTSSVTSSVTTVFYSQNQSSGGFQQNVAYAGDGTSVNAGSLPTCSGTSYLTRSPINGSQLFWIEPLGHMGGPHVLPSQGDHIYFYVQVGANNIPVPTPVYSPGNVTLLQVAAAKGNTAQESGTSYILFFSPCKSIMFGFQMPVISSIVQNAISGMTPTLCQNSTQQSFCVYAVSLKLKSGDRIGTIGVTNYDYGLDFAAADVRTQSLAFIDQRMSTGFLSDSYLHTVCPLDYFVNSTKAYLYSRLTASNVSQRSSACGTTMQDLPGTIQGNWYRKGSIGALYQGLNISASLAMAHLDVNQSYGIISAGTSLFPVSYGGAQLLFSPLGIGQVNRDPGQITPDGKVYCFQGPVGYGALYVNGSINRNNGPLGHVDIRMDNSTAIEVDYASGSCATTPVLTNPSIYVR